MRTHTHRCFFLHSLKLDEHSLVHWLHLQIPDILDSVKYDALHNSHLGLQNSLEVRCFDGQHDVENFLVASSKESVDLLKHQFGITVV